MKLIVEIPDEQYNRIVKAPRCVGFNEAVEDRTILVKAIQKATSLDSVKAEIVALPKIYPFINHIDTYVKEDDVLHILDNIGKTESEGKE